MLCRQWRNRRQRARGGPMSVGADKAYDMRDFVQTVREMHIRPHVAQNSNRAGGSAIDGRTTRHTTYRVSQSKRPLDREGVWLDEANRRHADDDVAGVSESCLAVPEDRRGPQSGAASEVANSRSVTPRRKTAFFNTPAGPFEPPPIRNDGRNGALAIIPKPSRTIANPISTSS